jgi:chemotaxis protein methyltransferase CheR
MTFETRAMPSLEYELFRRLIRDTFGLDYPPHKRELLRTRLDRRLRANGLRRYAEYYRFLCYATSAADEWMLLAEEITNNETYFFREAEQFDLLAQILPAIAGGATRGLRVLSAGCSSGEEAYGLAMVLANQLGRTASFEVRGFDLSEARLAEARAGRYLSKSFHRDEPAPRGIVVDDYMTTDGTGASVVRPFLRERVTFERGNLAEPRSVRSLGEFDVVFCRNVLIYADDESTPRFFESLATLVRPNGYLFLGSSDALDGPVAPFKLARIGNRFAYAREP